MKIVMLLFCFFSTYTWAISEQEFCESYSNLKVTKPTKKHSFKDTLTVLYTPGRIIDVAKIENDHVIEDEHLEETNRSNKVVFIHLPRPEVDKQALKELQQHVRA